MDYKNNKRIDLKIKPIKFHDIEVKNNYAILVSENEVFVQCENKNTKLSPQEKYSFFRCKFIAVNDVKYILLLVCSWANSLEGRLERHSIEADLKLKNIFER